MSCGEAITIDPKTVKRIFDDYLEKRNIEVQHQVIIAQMRTKPSPIFLPKGAKLILDIE